MIDIFDFWKDVGPECRQHPADEGVLARLGDKPGGLDLGCCPVPYYGPLKTAPIVLLYLNPGLSDQDKQDATTEHGQLFWWEQRQGAGFLRSQKGREQKSWWVSRTSFLGIDPEILRTQLAILEICPYHSVELKDRSLLSALPSCRKAVDWAQATLFPQAIAGQRIVICLRAAAYWGLVPGSICGQSLFVPETVRSGHLLKGDVREAIVAAVSELRLPSGE